MQSVYKILFLGETFRTDAQSWIQGIAKASGQKVDSDEVMLSNSRWIRAYRFFELIFKYAFVKRGIQYDFVLAERSTSYGLISLFVKARVRIVAQQGATDLFPGKWYHKLYKGYIQKIVYRKSDIIHAWGASMAQHMKAIGVPREKVIVLSKGIDLSKFPYVYPQDKTTTPWKIVVTRSLESYYGHHYIIEACHELIRSGYSLELHIVGSGSLLNQLQSLVTTLNLETSVIFHGRMDSMQLSSILQSAHFYISAPVTEGFSASLMESMACGCLPIVTDLPANRALIQHGANGFLFKSQDSLDIQVCLRTAIVQYHQMSLSLETNRRFVETQANLEFNMNLFWKKYRKVFVTKTIPTSS